MCKNRMDDDSFCNSSHKFQSLTDKFTICESFHIYFLRKN
ncbi:hypothetical protein LEP1GSC170_2783 [Leptospira interrogans serovar Bataviae str. HAI135]|nr:hypothetical protein LEP1GSC170_2783 [Leptospira interrogans serovar Bataviae str. HAI135]